MREEINTAIDAVLADAKPGQYVRLVEHVAMRGAEYLARATGQPPHVKGDDALFIFPDDPLRRLLEALNEAGHASATPVAAIVEGVITQLRAVAAPTTPAHLLN